MGVGVVVDSVELASDAAAEELRERLLGRGDSLLLRCSAVFFRFV